MLVNIERMDDKIPKSFLRGLCCGSNESGMMKRLAEVISHNQNTKEKSSKAYS
jgi:hypothetical protein